MTTSKIRDVLSKIDLAIKKYPELQVALTQRYGGEAFAASKECSALLQGIDAKVDNIQHTLDIEIQPSVNYSFIPDETLRETLYTLNRSMELKIMNIERADKTRAYLATCVEAFKQIEVVAKFVVNRPEIRSILSEESKELLRGARDGVSMILSSLKYNFYYDRDEYDCLMGLKAIRNKEVHVISNFVAEDNKKGKANETEFIFRERYPFSASVRAFLIRYMGRLQLILDNPEGQRQKKSYNVSVEG